MADRPVACASTGKPMSAADEAVVSSWIRTEAPVAVLGRHLELDVLPVHGERLRLAAGLARAPGSDPIRRRRHAPTVAAVVDPDGSNKVPLPTVTAPGAGWE